MMPNAWQFRFFAVTKDGVLLYFDTEIPDVEHLEAKARGKLDLKAVNFELSTDPIEGAPTPHGISIAAANEEKWKMCAETKDDQGRWLKVFNKYMALENKVLPRGPISYTSDDDNDRPGYVRGLPRMNSSLQPITPWDGNNNITSNSVNAATPTNNGGTIGKAKNVFAEDRSTATTNISNKTVVVPPPSIAPTGKKRLKTSLHSHHKPNYEEKDKFELILVMAIVNIAFLGLWWSSSLFSILFYLLLGNFVVIYTLQLRGVRAFKAVTEQHHSAESVANSPKQSDQIVSQSFHSNVIASDKLPAEEPVVERRSGKPIAGNLYIKSCFVEDLLCLSILFYCFSLNITIFSFAYSIDRFNLTSFGRRLSHCTHAHVDKNR